MDLKSILQAKKQKKQRKEHPFQQQAHYMSDKLHIDLKSSIIYMYYKAFKHAYTHNKLYAIDKAYSYLYDHPHNLSNDHKIRLFVKMYYVYAKK